MDVDLPAVAALIADPSRAAMLDALLSGGRHSARELAVAAGIAPSTATEHLDRLEAGGLVLCDRVGRRREVRLAGPEVGRALEALAAIAPPRRVSGLRAWHHGEALRAARSCYDHLAGRAGVALADGLVAGGLLQLGDGAFALTDSGAARLSEFGVDVDRVLGARRATARACVDWSDGARTSAARSAPRCCRSCWAAPGSRMRPPPAAPRRRAGACCASPTRAAPACATPSAWPSRASACR